MSFNPFKQRGISAEKQLRHWAELKFIRYNIKPSAKIAQKAYRFSPKQPGWRNITDISALAVVFCGRNRDSQLFGELT